MPDQDTYLNPESLGVGSLPLLPSSTPAVTGPEAAPALPSLNPANSPYPTLSLPELPKPSEHQWASQDQPPVQNLGAVSKAGAFAYMANQVIRSAVQGYDAARLQHAQQVNGKLQALGNLEKQLGDQYVRAYNEVGSSNPGMTPQQILADPHVAQLHSQLLAVHQTTMDTIQKYMPQLQQDGQQGGKGGKGEGKTGNKPNLLQRMFGQDPNEQLQAYYEAGTKLGPTAFYQVASPQQLSAMYQQRQGAAAEQGQATSEAEIGARKAQLENDLITAENKGDTAGAARAKKALEDLAEATSPYRRPTTDEMKRQDYQTLLATGQVPKDQQGNPLSFEAWTASQSATGRTAGSPAKDPIPYNANTGTIFDTRTGKTWAPTDHNLPLDVASKFAAADNQAFKKQQRALQLVAERGNAYLLGRVVQVADPSHPGTTIYMRALDAIRQGVPTPSSIWYKLEMPTGTERARADLAISAREQLNTMDQILTKRSDLFGPAAGQKTNFTQWVGSQDPDAQRFAAAARIASDHLAGVFGGRSQAALQAIYDAIGQNKTNPAAAVAALEQMNVAAAAIQGRGAGTVAPPPAGASPAAGAAAPVAPPSSTSGIDVTDPNGKVHHFDSQAQADHFKQLAGIK